VTGPTDLFAQLKGELITGIARDARIELDPNLDAYRRDPLRWAVEILGLKRATVEWSAAGPQYAGHRWDGDADPLLAAGRALTEDRWVAIEAGTGVGKTVWDAALLLWFLDCWPNAQVVTLAPKEKQLKHHLWRWANRFFPAFRRRRPTAIITSLNVRVRPPGHDWEAIGFPAGVGAAEDVAQKAAGFHAEHQLVIVEDTPGVDPAVLAAFVETSVAPHNLVLAVGNPDHQLDTLHQFAKMPRVVALRASALDYPNVVCDDPRLIPGGVSRASVEERLLKHKATGRRYLTRVRGISPAEASDALVKLTWCYAARDRGQQLCARLGIEDLRALLRQPALKLPAELEGPLAAGVDVANSQRGDLAAIALGRGAVCCAVDDFTCADATWLGQKVYQEVVLDLKVPGDRIGVDGIGVGAGTVGTLRNLNVDVVDIQSAAAAVDDGEEERYANLRAQMHWLAAQDLQHGRVILPDDEQLIEDLVVPRWEPRGGKIFVRPKEQIKKDLPDGRSPNKGDGFVYWNWVRRSQGAATIGGTVGINL